MPRWLAIADRLRSEREHRGLTQRGLARASGVALATIQRIERATSAPALDTVEQIATALGVDPGWLAYGPDQPTG